MDYTQLRLDRVYRCKTCGKSFLFLSDKDIHTQQTGHLSFSINSLVSQDARFDIMPSRWTCTRCRIEEALYD